MADLSDFKSGQIVGVRMAGTSITKPVELFGEVRSTVWKVIRGFEKKKKGKTCSIKQNSGRKRKLSVRDL